MLKKLELDSKKAALAATQALLIERSAEDDPIGVMQLTHRRDEISREIEAIGDAPEGTASIGLFFAGRPVDGSRGVKAEFAGKALERFQEIITKRFATQEAGVQLRSHGPVPFRDHSQLLITDIARGSVGFLLEEASDDAALVDTSLKRVVHEIVGIFEGISSEDDEGFDTIADRVDARLMYSMAQFFKQIDESGATFRVVEGTRDLNFRPDAIRRARQRAERTEVRESNQSLTGMLYILPDQGKFELHTSSGIVGGAVTDECLASVMSEGEVRDGVLRHRWQVLVAVKEVQLANRSPRKSYVLRSLTQAL